MGKQRKPSYYYRATTPTKHSFEEVSRRSNRTLEISDQNLQISDAEF